MSDLCSYNDSAVQMVSQIDTIEADVSFVIVSVNSLGIFLVVLLWLQLRVLHHPLHGVHVVLDIRHELDDPGEVDWYQEAVADEEAHTCRASGGQERGGGDGGEDDHRADHVQGQSQPPREHTKRTTNVPHMSKKLNIMSLHKTM